MHLDFLPILTNLTKSPSASFSQESNGAHEKNNLEDLVLTLIQKPLFQFQNFNVYIM